MSILFFSSAFGQFLLLLKSSLNLRIIHMQPSCFVIGFLAPCLLAVTAGCGVDDARRTPVAGNEPVAGNVSTCCGP